MTDIEKYIQILGSTRGKEDPAVPNEEGQTQDERSVCVYLCMYASYACACPLAI